MSGDDPTLFDLGGGDICENRHGGNEQSSAAHRKVLPHKAALRKLIFSYLAKCQDGLTVDELSRRLGLRYTTVSARISELKRDGLRVDGVLKGRVVDLVVDEQPVRRSTSSGCSAAVLVVISA